MEKQRILVVEDEPFQGDHLVRLLTRFGYEIAGGSPARTVDEATEFLKKHRVDVALLDIDLIDDSLGGVKLGEYIMNHFDIPFIYLTQQDDPRVEEKARETRYTDFLEKPCTDRALKRAIEDALLPPGLKQDDVPDEKTSTQVEYKKGRSWCWIKKGSDFYKVFIDDVHWIEADKSWSTFYTFPNGKTDPVKFIVSHNLSVTERALKEVHDLIRINQSFIVNITKIERRTSGGAIYLNDRTELVKKKFAGTDFFDRL